MTDKTVDPVVLAAEALVKDRDEAIERMKAVRLVWDDYSEPSLERLRSALVEYKRT